jgi:hypothetical protein
MRLGSFQIALHIFHPVLLQEHLDLFPERHFAMMFGLALNVFRRVLNAGDSDAECAVTFLPLEIPMLLERVVNPFGRIAFEKLDGLRRGERGRNREEDMHMVLHTANDQCLHFVLTGDAAEVRPEA